MLMSGCAVGICGECESNALFCVRVERAGGLEMRPDTRMTAIGLLNWCGVIVCVWTGAMVCECVVFQLWVGTCNCLVDSP
jgi:hypothetical protein